VALDETEGAELEVFGLSLWCNITLITQSPEEQGEELNETNNGSDNWVEVSFEFELSLREVGEDGKEAAFWMRVSEMAIWSGSEIPPGRIIEFWWKSPKDSKSVDGIDSWEGREEEK
jgi:hypothetical protein